MNPDEKREALIELIPTLVAGRYVPLWPADERDVWRRADWGSFRERDDRLDRMRREKVADAILARFNVTERDEDQAPIEVGDLVHVEFDNAVVTKIEDGRLHVGSARFYGGGVFDVEQVSKR